MSDSIHPNCRCSLNPVLKDHDEFMAELQAYVGGEDTPGAMKIDTWAVLFGLATTYAIGKTIEK